VLTSWAGWPAIFAVNVPIGLAAFVLTSRLVVAPEPRPDAGLDPLGQVLGVLAVASLASGLIQAGSLGWTSPWVLGALAVAVASGTAFVLVERRGRNPMLPPSLFGSPEFSGAIVVGAAINVGFYGELFLLTVYLQDVRHLGPLLAGLAMLPQAGMAAPASPLAGGHVARFGARPVMLTGLGIGALGLLATAAAGSDTPYWLLVVPLMAIGFGTAYTMPAATAAAIEAAPDGRAGAASGALNASRQIGSTLGVAVFGTVAATASTFVAGLRVSVLVGAAVFLAGALTVLATVPRTARVGT
jgi:MFS transporter, DHA2 family, methylenomycin A resistance protein